MTESGGEYEGFWEEVRGVTADSARAAAWRASGDEKNAWRVDRWDTGVGCRDALEMEVDVFTRVVAQPPSFWGT